MSTNPKLHSMCRNHQPEGSTLITVLAFIVVTSMVFGAVLTRNMNTYRQVSHIAAWQEALLAAEGGSDSAMAELRKTLIDPTSAFSGWVKTAEDGTPLPNSEKRFDCAQLVHKGEGNTQLDMSVTIDTPASLIDGGGRQWYRIRSTGTTYLPGPARLTTDKRDHPLRRLSFIWNPKTNATVSRPQSSRLVELIVKPTSFENAIVSDQPIYLNNHKITVDSYDSRYTDKSTNGLYDPSKRLENGDVATNSKMLDAGDATILGDAYTNAGVIVDGANISGDQRHDFYQELIPIPRPDWTIITPSAPLVAGSATLLAGSKASPTRYKLSSMAIEGTSTVTFANPTPGTESYVEVWITGDLKTSGSGTIVVQPNTNVKIFVEGNMDIKGNGTINANSQPGRMQIFGVKPSTSAARNIYIAGNGILCAAIFAPNHDVVFGAVGASGTMWGSLTGKSLSMGGATQFHYDEALADAGHITDSRIHSWFEDVK